ncbi:TRAP transporter small permease [Rhodospirillum sp. A1_3_36]|uniref:TRAP transporter small permease n=1 Tax=Rhodospirillum sp. A1_3_36 TaxID=3391666 RepID=UPI0039A483C5
MPGHPQAPHDQSAPSRASALFRHVLGGICALLLLAMMALTLADVVGRYLFSAPLSGAGELTELLLAAVIFIGLPAVCLDDGHVTADLVVDRLPRAIQPARRVLVTLTSALVLGVIAWRLAVHGVKLIGYGEATLFLHIPIWPLALGTAFCTGLSALVVLANLFPRPPSSGGA